ncbi:hypothetical protein [Scytonema sp. HK-05]|uniref:hypothetical protein n=1 Tax=Scytonema sp. HK-05 TaxID=1137095 RepID=UPI0009F82506|nr:hypothetical protein [Scytonema sp. HK-05]
MDEYQILADECLIFVDELIRVVTQYLMLYRVPTRFGSIDADFSGDFDGGLGAAIALRCKV